jgi:hypothetical protein
VRPCAQCYVVYLDVSLLLAPHVVADHGLVQHILQLMEHGRDGLRSVHTLADANQVRDAVAGLGFEPNGGPKHLLLLTFLWQSSNTHTHTHIHTRKDGLVQDLH